MENALQCDDYVAADAGAYKAAPAGLRLFDLLFSSLMACGELGESYPDLDHHAVPVTRFRLAELPERRIPRTVIPIEQPSPTRVESIEQPHRFA